MTNSTIVKRINLYRQLLKNAGSEPHDEIDRNYDFLNPKIKNKNFDTLENALKSINSLIILLDDSPDLLRNFPLAFKMNEHIRTYANDLIELYPDFSNSPIGKDILKDLSSLVDKIQKVDEIIVAPPPKEIEEDVISSDSDPTTSPIEKNINPMPLVRKINRLLKSLPQSNSMINPSLLKKINFYYQITKNFHKTANQPTSRPVSSNLFDSPQQEQQALNSLQQLQQQALNISNQLAPSLQQLIQFYSPYSQTFPQLAPIINNLSSIYSNLFENNTNLSNQKINVNQFSQNVKSYLDNAAKEVYQLTQTVVNSNPNNPQVATQIYNIYKFMFDLSQTFNPSQSPQLPQEPETREVFLESKDTLDKNSTISLQALLNHHAKQKNITSKPFPLNVDGDYRELTQQAVYAVLKNLNMPLNTPDQDLLNKLKELYPQFTNVRRTQPAKPVAKPATPTAPAAPTAPSTKEVIKGKATEAIKSIPIIGGLVGK